MQDQDDLKAIEQLIHKLESLHDSNQLNDSQLNTLQERLDVIAKKHQDNEQLGSKRVVLYELQALILLSKGESSAAEQCMQQAVEVGNYNPPFVSRTGRAWYLSYLDKTAPNNSEVLGKSKGWFIPMFLFGVIAGLAWASLLLGLFVSVSTQSMLSNLVTGTVFALLYVYARKKYYRI